MYVNIDIDTRCNPFLNALVDKGNVTKKDVESFLDVYSNNGVTDLLFCIFCQYSSTDSKVWNSYADKYLQKTENGKSVDYTDIYYGFYDVNKKYGIDPIGCWIEESKNRGINPWISLRMNDCHCPDEETCFLRSDFFYEAREKGWMVGDKYGYFRNIFDYSVPEVRRKMLDYIDEQLDRYDVYGIELDFVRELICFDYINKEFSECAAVINEFMRQVKKIVVKYEEKYGHKIKIAVRVSRDIDQNIIYGYDARTWCREKLVDMVVPTSRWKGSDSQIPVDVWKKELPGIDVIPSIEVVIRCEDDKLIVMNAETCRGTSAIFKHLGADGTYYFNFFGDGEYDAEIYRTTETVEEISKYPSRYVLIGQEDDTCPHGCEPYRPIPHKLNGDKYTVEFVTGNISQKSKQLIIGLNDGDISDVDIWLNGNKCENFEKTEPLKHQTTLNKYFVCDIDTNETCQKFEFVSHKDGIMLDWIEIYAK